MTKPAFVLSLGLGLTQDLKFEKICASQSHEMCDQ